MPASRLALGKVFGVSMKLKDGISLQDLMDARDYIHERFIDEYTEDIPDTIPKLQAIDIAILKHIEDMWVKE